METRRAELEVQAEAAVGIRQMPGSVKQDSFLVVNEDSDSSIFITKTDEAVHEVCFTRDGVFSLSTGQDKLFLQKLQPLLARVPSGYSLSLLVYEAHRCGPQAETQGLIQKVMEAVLQEPHSASKNALRLQTVSFVQIYEDGKARDLLSPKSDTLQVMELPPLGLMVEEATEIVVADPRAATRLYLQGRSLHQSCLQQSLRKRHETTCGSLLTITVETKVDDRGLRRTAVRIFDLFAGGRRPCANPLLPLLRAASHRALPSEAGFCSRILRHLLEENALTFLLLCLTLPDASGEEMQTALTLTGQVRAMAKRVAQTRWDPAQEIQRRRAAIAELRTRVFFGAQTEQGCLLSSLGRAVKELQVLKGQNWVKKKAGWACEMKEDAPLETRVPSERGDGSELGNQLGSQPSQEEAHKKKVATADLPLVEGHSAPDVRLGQGALQEGALGQNPSAEASCAFGGPSLNGTTRAQSPLPPVQQEAQLWQKEEQLPTLHVEALKRERAEVERGLNELHQEHRHESETRKKHVLQVFQAYRTHMEEQADAHEQRYRQLLRDSLQDALCLSTQNQQLRAQRQLSCTERATQTDFLAPKQSQKAP